VEEIWSSGESPAEVYEHYLVPGILAPWTPDLLAVATLRPGERVLDVACGTGLVARAAAPRVGSNGQVVGLDINPGMLAMGRRASATAGVSIEWLNGNAISLPLSDAAFDVVLCQQGLQFFPDRPATLREMNRVLVGGGRLALSVWRSIEHNPGQVALAEGLLRHVGSEAAARVHEAFSLGDDKELRTLMAAAGFVDAKIHSAVKKARFQTAAEFVRRVVTSALAGTGILVTEKTLATLITDVSRSLRSYVDNDGLSFPDGSPARGSTQIGAECD
jgi:ubiquinone/menaquinone biosynthesis C-methylase UbiE